MPNNSAKLLIIKCNVKVSGCGVDTCMYVCLYVCMCVCVCVCVCVCERVGRSRRTCMAKVMSTLFQIFNALFAYLRKVSISFDMSVRPHGTTLLPIDGFSWTMIC
jgi:hypothetical protein